MQMFYQFFCEEKGRAHHRHTRPYHHNFAKNQKNMKTL